MAALQVLIKLMHFNLLESNIWFSHPECGSFSVCCCKTTTCVGAELKTCLIHLHTLSKSMLSFNRPVCVLGCLWLNRAVKSEVSSAGDDMITSQTSTVLGNNCPTNMSPAFYY